MVREHNFYDSFGRLIREVDYNASGTVIANNDAAAVDTFLGYTGRDFDSDTGLQYNRARWYDPQTGRWLSQDPIGFAAGDANLYRSVGNGATNATDPSGFAAEGHHWIPILVSWKLYSEGIITQREFLYFAARRSGGLVVPHNWGTTYEGVCHQDYIAEVEKQIRRWKSSKDPTKVTMKTIADRISDGKSWNGTKNKVLQTFNEGIRGDLKPLTPGKKNTMDGEGLTEDQIVDRGRSSIKKRGKSLLIIGIFGNIMNVADAYGKASNAGEILSGRGGPCKTLRMHLPKVILELPESV